MDIGKRIFELRSNAGFTQEELAEKLRISRQSVTKWESGDSIPDIESSRLHFHDLSYEDGKYSYLDSFFGREKFIGEEVLYVDNSPFWPMNYLGRVIDSNFSGDFLKECLLAVKKDKPYRGPEILQNGNFTYHCNVKGSFDWFMGEEEIFFQAGKVYECVFHGSIIK